MKTKFQLQLKNIMALLVSIVILSYANITKPHLYIIGDSTVKNGHFSNGQELVGWGECLKPYFDTNKIEIINQAIPGRSSRTYVTEKHWKNVLEQMQKGDFLMLQFGHNDPGNISDSLKPRGSLQGIGDDSILIFNYTFNKKEYVHAYGWYLRKIISDAKAKGILPIIVSPIPRHIFKNGKVVRANKDYALWSKDVAQQANIPFINLNDQVANIYDIMGFQATDTLFPKDHTHTNLAGAIINAAQVIKAIHNQNDLKILSSYLITSPFSK